MQEAQRPFYLRNQSSHVGGAGIARRPGGPMSILMTILWAIIAAVTAWGITLAHATAAIARLQAERRKEIRHWQGEAARAKAHAALLARDAATWSAGYKQGREEVIAIMPLLAAAHQRLMEPSRAAGDIAEST